MAGCFGSNLPFEMVPHHPGFRGRVFATPAKGEILEPDDGEQVYCVGERLCEEGLGGRC